MSLLTPKTAGFVNLSYCVATVQADRDDFDTRLVEKCTQLAIRAYTDLNLFTSMNVEVVYLTMDANGIADISTLTDYVDYIKVGVAVNGKWWVLNKNSKVLPRRDELDASELALIFKTGGSNIEVTTGYDFAPHYVGTEFVSGHFGIGGGFSRSYFNIDLEKMQIQFDTSIPNKTEVILEYYSTGVKLTGATLIPRYCVEYIVAYIHWKLKEHNPLINRFEVRDAKQEFLERENMMRSFQLRFRPVDYYQATYSTMKQTIKQ